MDDGMDYDVQTKVSFRLDFGDVLVEHHFAVHRLIQRLTMLQCQQQGCNRILAKAAGGDVLFLHRENAPAAAIWQASANAVA